jgi:hypothetical protein
VVVACCWEVADWRVSEWYVALMVSLWLPYVTCSEVQMMEYLLVPVPMKVQGENPLSLLWKWKVGNMREKFLKNLIF